MAHNFSRRAFLAAASGLPAAAGLRASATLAHPPSPGQSVSQRTGGFRGEIVFFSKPLPQMDWQRLAANVKRLGFDGIDLTVRPEGHVLPERVEEDLPKAVAAISPQFAAKACRFQ